MSTGGSLRLLSAATMLRAQHRCDVCRRTGAWEDGWQWFSSILIEENCGHYLTTCSEYCRANARPALDQFELAHPPRKCNAHLLADDARGVTWA